MGFLASGLGHGDPVAIAVPPPRARLLAELLGPPGPDLAVLDMFELGRNPGRIIPAVLAMIERHDGRLLHYVGEPVWPGRSAEEIQEATRHEALINLAWPGARIRVLCPYDAAGLGEQVLLDAQMTHPWLLERGTAVRSAHFGGSAFPAGTDGALSPPPADAAVLTFAISDLTAVRAVVAGRAVAAGVDRERTDDLIIAVNEVASNAIKHSDSVGLLQVWAAPTELICQVHSTSHIADPLAGRHRPAPGVDGGIGLWMVNQLCDLVETRTSFTGTTIRLHVRRG